MRNLTSLFLIVFALVGQLAQAEEPPSLSKAKLAGHYYLSGMPEVGSELVLDSAGKFQWMLAYGSMDQYAKGSWKLRGRKVVLTPEPGKPGRFRLFKEDEMNVRKGPRYGTWVAIVGVPHEGPIPGVEVRFESESGQLASAVSDGNGDAIVEMRSSEAWKRTGLRRADSDDAWIWFDMPSERAQARIAGFAVDNPIEVLNPPFKSLTLAVHDKGLKIVDPTSRFTGIYKKR